MPYIKQEDRNRLGYVGATGEIENVGQLNYCITKIVDEFLGKNPRYADMNGAIGALDCAKMELYRRVVSEMEDMKIEENGDVYKARVR